MDLEFRFGKAGERASDGADEARLLVIGDFGGGRSGPVAARPFQAATAEGLDALMAGIGPRIELAVGGPDGGATVFEPGSMDGLHPDALAVGLPVFAALAQQRRRLQAPATSVAASDDTATIERLLGARPAAAAGAAGPVGLEGWLRELVAPHVTRPADPRQGPLVAALDEVASHTMRRVLRDPAFRAAEATWRGLHLLVGDADEGPVRVDVLDVARAELLDAAAALGSRLPAAHPPFALVVAVFSFGPSDEDLAVLEALGEAVASAGLSLLAAAEPTLIGAASAADLKEPGRWAAPGQRWSGLRAGAVARHIGLATPRVLLRRPYGPRSEPIEAMPFDELGGATGSEGLAWGNPALACARMIAAGFREASALAGPGQVSVLDDLPLHVVTEGGERAIQPCAEEFLSDRAVEAVLARGLIALVSARDRPRVRVPRFQSIAAPAAPLAGPWQGS